MDILNIVTRLMNDNRQSFGSFLASTATELEIAMAVACLLPLPSSPVNCIEVTYAETAETTVADFVGEVSNYAPIQVSRMTSAVKAIYLKRYEILFGDIKSLMFGMDIGRAGLAGYRALFEERQFPLWLSSAENLKEELGTVVGGL